MKKNALSKSELESMMEEEELEQNSAEKPRNQHVVDELEKQAVDGYKTKKSNPHPLPPEMYRKLTKFIDKYGEDFEVIMTSSTNILIIQATHLIIGIIFGFKAMAMDHTNHYQETAAQLRTQVNRLKNIPQQWVPYLKSRGLVVVESTE